MKATKSPDSGPVVPEIVSAVLRQVEKRRLAGELSQEDFDSKIARLIAEDLAPNGLALNVRETRDGRRHFVVTCSRSGKVCDQFVSPARPRSAPRARPVQNGMPALHGIHPRFA